MLDLVGFGGGSHRCLGVHFAYLEMAVILSRMLQWFDFELQVTDPQPVTRVELAAPDGRIFLAHHIDRERLTRRGGGYYGQPTMGVGVGGGSGGCCWGGSGVGLGVGFGFPLGDAREPDYGPAGVASTALVQVPDMAAYRAHWQQWKVRIYLGEGGSERMVEVAAPQPNAG